MRVAEMKGDEMQGKLTLGEGSAGAPYARRERFLTTILDLRQSWGFLNGENPHAPGNFY